MLLDICNEVLKVLVPDMFYPKTIENERKVMGQVLYLQIPMGFLQITYPWGFSNITSCSNSNTPVFLRLYMPLHILIYTQPSTAGFPNPCFYIISSGI